MTEHQTESPILETPSGFIVLPLCAWIATLKQRSKSGEESFLSEPLPWNSGQLGRFRASVCNGCEVCGSYPETRGYFVRFRRSLALLHHRLKTDRVLYLGGSRESGGLRRRMDWSRAVRGLLQNELYQRCLLVSPSSSPLNQLAKFLSTRTGWTMWNTCASRQTSFEKWLNEEIDSHLEHWRVMEVSVSPNIWRENQESIGEQFPIQDLVCFLLANEVRLLSVRTNGRLESFVNRFQKNSDKRIYVLQSKLSEPKRKQANRFGNRVIRWLVPPLMEENNFGSDDLKLSDSFQKKAGGIIWPKIGQDSFLVHHTRGYNDPWLGENSYRFFERWLHGKVSDGTPVHTLIKILTEGRIRASGRFIYQNQPMVCFTQMNPKDSRPVFRRHIRRWDWLPYGIGIERDYLEKVGAERVRYIDPRKESPSCWTQPKTSPSKEGRPRIDWSQEREYRIRGDVVLGCIPIEKVFVFVKTKAESQQVVAYTNFPVYFFEED